MTKTGLYVYALVSAEGTVDAELGAGIDDEPLRTVTVPGGLAAVVHACDPEPYQGPDSDVERWILEHSRVIDRAWETAGTVLPVSFNVIVSPGDGEHADDRAEDRLAEWLADSAPDLLEHLEKLRGRVELRVEIAMAEEAVATSSRELIELQEATASRPAGVQRLYRKRFEQRTREIAEKLADRLYPDYRRRLAAVAEELVENQRPGRSPGTVTVLTVSLLVPQEGVDAVGVELADIRDNQPGARIRYLGPWPPYSFADIPELGDSGAAETPTGRE